MKTLLKIALTIIAIPPAGFVALCFLYAVFLFSLFLAEALLLPMNHFDTNRIRTEYREFVRGIGF